MEHLRTTRDRHLTAYHAAKNAMADFNAQALLWIDYSNRRQLTDEEQAVVDEVNLIYHFEVSNFSFRLFQKCPITK